MFILLGNWNTGLKCEDSANISSRFWCFPPSQHLHQTFVSCIWLLEKGLVFSAIKIKVMHGCSGHCYAFDFLARQGVSMCKFTQQIMKALIFVLVTSTLSLLSPSHLPFLVHLWHFSLHPLQKSLKSHTAVSHSHGAAYESVDSLDSVISWHLTVDCLSNTLGLGRNCTMQKCRILASSIDLVWCNYSKAVLKCCRQMAIFTLQSWWPFLPLFCLICKVYRSAGAWKLGNGRRIRSKSKRVWLFLLMVSTCVSISPPNSCLHGIRQALATFPK